MKGAQCGGQDKETDPTMTDTKTAERIRERRPRGRRPKASR